MAGAIINHSSINLKFKKAVNAKSSVIKPKLERAKKKAFDEFIRDFKNHPITKEIAAGPEASNSSGTLGGYGNLFSFIGFDANDKPIMVIQEYIINKLRKSIRMVPDTSKGGWKVTFDMPSLEDIAALTPMPWAGGRSWVVGIHAGISGLGQYLYTQRASHYTTRSGTAFQTDTRLRGGGFQNTPYMVPLLRFLEKRLNEQIRIMVRS
tara:strand:- start:1875 stop:2498 length:624 start_codon:yes stop_codon:yes gene_type:complete